MAVLLTDPDLEQRLIAERAACGGDRLDEVWDGVYFMPPPADDEHQAIQLEIAAILLAVAGRTKGAQVRAGINVSDREHDWKENYRIPDVAVFMPGTTARNCHTFWLGGPDMVVEITSHYDRTRDKLPFYSKVGVRELLVIDRQAWTLELYRPTAGQLALAGQSTVDQSDSLASTLLPLQFRLIAGTPRPRIEVKHADGVQQWIV